MREKKQQMRKAEEEVK
jgi:hypothetical protein